MPEIQIRPAIETDIPILTNLYHHYQSDYAWQMDFDQDRENNHIAIHFRKIRLPRSIKVEYPWSPNQLAQDWMSRPALLVAELAGAPIAYTSISLRDNDQNAFLNDLVVHRHLRRQGIGSALVWSCLDWASQTGAQSLVLEVQPKNNPAICMAQKLGFEFIGYHDRHFPHNETCFFFGKRI